MKPYNEELCLQVKAFWESKGLSAYAVCGWLANWLCESGFIPNNAQNSYMKKYGLTDEEYTARVDNGTWSTPDTNLDFGHDKIGYGLAQWTSSGRKQGFWDYMRGKGVSVGDMNGQLEYSYVEYTSKSFAKTREGLESAKSAYDAAIVIMTTYEKPASMNDPNKQKERGDLAEEFYQKYYGADQHKTFRLALSAGHYLYTPGKRCMKAIDPLETREWVLNSRIADMLTDKLMNYKDVEIIRLDDPTGETPTSLQERADKSDEHNADFYLAIHHNAGVNGGSGGGVVVYHYPTTKNREQAQALYNAVVDANGLKGNRATPIVATTDLFEVAVPEADSILLENGFMDSTTDTPIILTPEYAKATADGLCKFFVDYFGLQLKKSGNASDVLAEIESIRNNIKALEVELDKKLVELGALIK